MSWKLIETKTRKLTTALAKEFATMTQVPNERPLSERRLEVYRALVEKGEWRPITWGVATCTETEEVFRINGMHTSTMFSQMEKIPDELYVNVEKYECDAPQDVARLYSTFDSKLASRTVSDIINSFAGTIPELECVNRKVVQLAVAGMSYFKWRGTGVSQAQDRAELMFNHIQFILWLDSIMPQQTQEVAKLRRAPVVASMFTQWQKSQKAATEFWVAVRDETGAKPDLPDRKLARFLTNTWARSKSEKSGKHRASEAEFYAKCTHAWNAWRKGETTNLNYYPQAKIPVAV